MTFVYMKINNVSVRVHMCIRVCMWEMYICLCVYVFVCVSTKSNRLFFVSRLYVYTQNKRKKRDNFTKYRIKEVNTNV